MLSHCILWN